MLLSLFTQNKVANGEVFMTGLEKDKSNPEKQGQKQ